MRKPTEFENHPATFEDARDRQCLRGVVRVVTDGDTYDAMLDMGLGLYWFGPLRLLDFDTAEIFHPRNDAEKQHGLAARDFAVGLLLDKPVLVRTYKDAETFGRFVAAVWFWDVAGRTWNSLRDALAAGGFAKRASY